MTTRVLIVHQSAIVSEGLFRLLQNSSLQLHDLLRTFNNPADITIHGGSNYLFITSLPFFQSLNKIQLLGFPEANYRFIELKTEYLPDQAVTGNSTIYLDDTHSLIIEKVRNTVNSFQQEKHSATASLTERETEVLKLVALGNASKEIADKLNISTHTVITHRKNITEKLGIKSISGLTVFAILNNIIDTNELSIDDLI
jgi:DNA-binding CsgD family transcriptional regulator